MHKSIDIIAGGYQKDCIFCIKQDPLCMKHEYYAEINKKKEFNGSQQQNEAPHNAPNDKSIVIMYGVDKANNKMIFLFYNHFWQVNQKTVLNLIIGTGAKKRALIWPRGTSGTPAHFWHVDQG